MSISLWPMWLYAPGHETTFVRIYLSYYPINALYIRLTRPVSQRSIEYRASRSLSARLLHAPCLRALVYTLHRVRKLYIYNVYIVCIHSS